MAALLEYRCPRDRARLGRCVSSATGRRAHDRAQPARPGARGARPTGSRDTGGSGRVVSRGSRRRRSVFRCDLVVARHTLGGAERHKAIRRHPLRCDGDHRPARAGQDCSQDRAIYASDSNRVLRVSPRLPVLYRPARLQELCAPVLRAGATRALGTRSWSRPRSFRGMAAVRPD